MALLSGTDVPYVVVSKDGTDYRLPVQQTGREGYERPTPVVRSPKMSFPQPVAIAGQEGGQYRRNYDVDEMILSDFSGGIGEDTARPGQPITSAQTTRCDTRWEGVLVPRPLATVVGTGTTNSGHRVYELGYTNARLLKYGNAAVARYLNGTTWTDITTGGNDFRAYQHALGLNGLWLAGYWLSGITQMPILLRSTNGTTYHSMALGGSGIPHGVAVFDERLFVLESTPNSTVGTARQTHIVYSSTDVVSAAAAGGTWTTGNQFTTATEEDVVKLFVWMYPGGRDQPTLWAMMAGSLWYYDYYAATPVWHEWHRVRSALKSSTKALNSDCFVHPLNGNLYACWDGIDAVWEFTGSTITPLKPNKRGGLPDADKVQPNVLGGTDNFLYVFGLPKSGVSAATGLALFMREGGSFGYLHGGDASVTMHGGGVGEGKIWTVIRTTATQVCNVYEIDNPDEDALPQHTTARSYDSAACPHTTGWLHANLLNVNKRALYFEVDAIKADGSPGLDTGDTILIEYRRRGASFVTTTTLTSASTFPAVVPISGGYTNKELQVRVTLDRGATATSCPRLKALKIGYRPRPKQRHTHTVRVDIRDDAPAFSVDGTYHGMSASALRLLIDEFADHDDAGLDDTLVGLAYGGGGNLLHPRRRSIPTCELSIQSQESADDADGLFLLVFSDISAPSSG